MAAKRDEMFAAFDVWWASAAQWTRGLPKSRRLMRLRRELHRFQPGLLPIDPLTAMRRWGHRGWWDEMR